MKHQAATLLSHANLVYILQLSGVLGGYFLLGKWGLEFASLKPIVSLLWPASGFALAVLLLAGIRMWPGIALGAFLVNLSIGIGTAPAAIIAAGNSLEAIIAWLLLHHYFKFDTALGRTADVFALLLAAVLGSIFAAGLGSLVYGLSIPDTHFVDAGLIWWMGDMTGILVFTPVILIWMRAPTWPSWRYLMELLALLGCVVWISQQVFFDPRRLGDAAYPAALTLLPFAVWAALRFGRHGATAYTAGVGLFGIAGTWYGSGLFITGSPLQIMLRWWEYTTLVAVAALLLAALRTERIKAWLALAQSHHHLEKQIEERTALLQQSNCKLQAEIAARQQLERHLVEVGEQRRRRFGQDLHDGLGQYLTGISMMSHGLALALQERLPELAPQAQRLHLVAIEAQKEGHNLACGLYPATLEKLGLYCAIEELAKANHERDGIACSVQKAGTDLPDLSTATAIHLFRIVQEALHNAVRHGRATYIQIEILGTQKALQITVRDNGSGFEPATAHAKNSLGFHLMRQRAAVLGAQFKVASVIGQGSEISLCLPLPILASESTN